MTINFYLPRYKSKKPEQTIFCRIYENKKELNLNTDRKVDPKFWDKESQRVNIRKVKNPTHKGKYTQVNKFLSDLENDLTEIYYRVRNQNHTASFDEIVNAINENFNKKEEEEINIHTAFKSFIIIKEEGYGNKNPIKYRTVQKYQRLQKLLIDFEKYKKKKIIFSDIGINLLGEIFQFMITELKFLNDTAYKNLQYLKTFFTYCYDNKYLLSNEYKNYETNVKEKDNEVIYLTREELIKLYNLELKNERLERVRDVFCFQCYTGQRYSDIENITRKQINKEKWNIRTVKNAKTLSIPLSDYALNILEKYKEFENPLPIISNQKMNKYLKELCKIAGFDEIIITSRKRGTKWIETEKPKYEYIGTHTARRTFVTMKINSGWSAEEIMKVTGHSDYKMVKKYFDIMDPIIENKMKEDDRKTKIMEEEMEEEKRKQLVVINMK